MEVENKEEKIKFLEEILKIAEENPEIITLEGRGIFYEDYPAFDEECSIGIHLDEKGKPYFKIQGSYSTPERSGPLYNPEKLLESGERYLRRDLDKFKQGFHIYETRDGGLDLLDKIR